MMRSSWLLILLFPAMLGHGAVEERLLGNASEKHLSSDIELKRWSRDSERLLENAGDRLEVRDVLIAEPETIKLQDVVPPILFESGVAQVPDSTVAELREVLDGMRNRANVRLNLVGHADNQRLSAALAARYGDNYGLSRERAGEVAEFFQRALDLPPEAVSYEWEGDSKPVASNATEAGRALNRRVEVEVWFDLFTESVAEEEVVVVEEIPAVKICRMETVCKLRYVEGHARRARVQNLLSPLHYEAATLTVPTEFVTQIQQTLDHLSDKQNVVVKFIGHTDNAPLSDRDARIYGDQLSLSRARAHRVALAVQDQLDLPANAIASDGYGASRLAASNATPRGRALNRRVEVEFWYDDSLQELPNEPQLCPADAGSEVVTRSYDPPWGPIASVELERGQPVIPDRYLDALRRGLAEVADHSNARLRFIGYTSNEALDRRTALIYGDDVGLSTARAKRTMESVAERLELSADQVEHEGKGYLHSKDVINAGFIQGEDSYVEVQIVYDELAVLDDYEGVDVDPLTRELQPENPFALNLMRITVDGEPIDDPQRSSADVQRCTDVAMEENDLRFSFDTLVSEPRLDVAANTDTVRLHTINPTVAVAAPVRFRMYTNYAAFMDRAEVRVYTADQSTEAEPMAVIPVDDLGEAEWRPETEQFDGPVRELKYVLRAYDAQGIFDETYPRPLWVAHSGLSPAELFTAVNDPTTREGAPPPPTPAFDGYGKDALALQNIPLGSGTVTVQGQGLPADREVWVAGAPVPKDSAGNFVSEVVLPDGAHTVEVALLDQQGNGELYLRDLELENRDWFYMGMADFTWTEASSSENAELFVGDNASQDFDSSMTGRISFFASGKFANGWGLTTSLDTREGELDELFSNFLGKEPDALFRRLDPDLHYPTFGDDSTVVELAPTQGKLYLKAEKGDSHGLWGNYKVGYMNNELAQVDRGLYGAKGHYESEATTSFGEKRLVVDLFGAEPGTVPSRQEFLGTGGSFYYLRHQDILMGSERVRIEVRDKASGIVTGVVNLNYATDYDIDYLQGTVLLSEPLAATVADDLLVRANSTNGDEAYLVVRYEYTPGFDDISAIAAGGQAHYWLNDRLKVGLMANENSNDDSDFDSSLQAADMTFRVNANTWVKVQGGRSEGVLAQSFTSRDGGFEFDSVNPVLTPAKADAYRGDVSVGLDDLWKPLDGRITLYGQSQEAGYSAPGLETPTDTDAWGGTLSLQLTRALSVRGKTDVLEREDGLSTSAQELNVGYRFSPRWDLSAGVRRDDREDDSGALLPTQELGARTDAVLQLGYDARGKWNAYGFVQESLNADEGRDANARFGAGGSYLLSEKLRVDLEVSDGDLGPGTRVGTSYLHSERTTFYMNYALESERTDNGARGARGPQGSLVSGMKTRLSDSTSIFLEERYQHGRSLTGLTHATGMQLAPSERWNLSVTSDFGTLEDRLTGADTERRAAGVSIGFGTENLQLSSGLEYRNDQEEQQDASVNKRKTWLNRNTFRWQMNPSSRLLGRFNFSTSDSSQGAFFDGEYTEAVLGYAFRPVRHDRLNAMLKYTYFYNVPTTSQVTQSNAAAQYLQKSHVAALDVTYDLTQRLSVGGKYAHKVGEISLDRVDPDFFNNSANLYVLRADYRFRAQWEVLLEGRVLEMKDLEEQRAGALFALSRYFGEHFKVGAGYNFTDFSDDLTDLNYDHQGLFLNLTGAF
ncbi:MAG: OmpA family protein [Pseudomonadota bacterium]